MSERFLGVDIGSKKLGLALLLRDGPELVVLDIRTIRPPAGWSLERRLARIDDELVHLIALPEHGGWSPDIMAVEEPWQVVGRGKVAFAALWRTVGHCECMAQRFGMAFHLVPVHDWRRTSAVKGPSRAAFKRNARRMAEVLLKKKLPEDEAEAALVARHAALTIK